MFGPGYTFWIAGVREDIAAERVAEPVVVSAEGKSYCGSCYLPLSHGVHDSLCDLRVEANSA